MLRNLTPAPDFELPDADGQPCALSGLRAGRPFLLLFTRFADCPTSRRDLMAYANVYGRIRMVGAEMAAVSADTVEAHQQLRDDLWIPFPILSDFGFRVSEEYGVYRSDELNEGPQPHGEPAVFVLDAEGKVAYSQICSGPKGLANPAELALVLLYMQQNGGRYW